VDRRQPATCLYWLRSGKRPWPRTGRFDTNPTPDADYVWDLSPDGTRIAILKQSEGRIHVLDLGSQSSNEMVVKGWSTFQSVNWAADGKGLFVASLGEAGSVLFRTDLRGNAHPLWEQQGNNTPWTNIVQRLGNHPSLGEWIENF
jgi:hypothetical protein